MLATNFDIWLCILITRAQDMFAAGTDTTYIVLEWAMSELMKNPTTMRKLEHEVRSRSAGGIAKADMLGAAATPYLKAS
jgi:cytochrome P450